jgi:hypothetical protein
LKDRKKSVVVGFLDRPWKDGRDMSDEEPFTCELVERLASEYLDRELSHRDVVLFEEHLRHCLRCTADLRGLRRTIFVLGRLRTVEGGQADNGRLVDVFRSWKWRGRTH